jgi:hypothetical protein
MNAGAMNMKEGILMIRMRYSVLEEEMEDGQCG